MPPPASTAPTPRAVAPLVATLLLAAVPAAAQPRAAVRAGALRFMTIPLAAFETARRARPAPYDWSANGCNFGESLGPYRALFNRACNRHDFGYRNFGTGRLQLERTEARRAAIDQRLRDDLTALCQAHEAEGTSRAACLSLAQTVYTSVRTGGAPWFFSNVPVPTTLNELPRAPGALRLPTVPRLW